jgi:predicted aldo/keto reductase-like oxidoreductase
MKYRKDPKSGKEISALGFGCMRFPRMLGVTDMKKSTALVASAIERGINYFDTARIYPGNEEALGTILERLRAREKVSISTKLPSWLIKTSEDIDAHFEASRKKLRTGSIDYYLMHMLSEFQSWENLKRLGIEEWIARKKKTGEIRHIGFSFHGQCEQYLSILGDYDWDAVLIQYNYSNENFQAGVVGLKAAAAKGIPVFIMEPLLGGKLTRDLPRSVREVFKKARPDWSPAAWGLNWLWNQPEITMILSGMNAMEQLDDNIAMASRAAPSMLSESDLAAFAQARILFNEAYKIKCTGCSYCLPCPRGVNIPGCFAAYNASFAIGLFSALLKYGQTVSYTAKTMRNAGRCVLCGKCEQHCPQSIPIRDGLTLVKKRLETPWFWLPLLAARKLMRI